MDSNLSLYKIFYTVANTGNISKASRELFISQPAISKSIQKLEQNLGATLFARSSRGVTLTHEGEVLYNHVHNAFQSISMGEEALAKELSGESGSLHIGVSTILCKYLLLPVLKDFIQENPNIQISITCQSSAKTIQMLEQGQLDLGLVAESNVGSELHFLPVGKIHDVFVTSPDYHKHLNLPSFASSEQFFKSATVMLLDKENITRQYVTDYLNKNHVEAQNFLEVSDMDLIMEFARISMGIGCVIREFVLDDLKEGRLIEIPMKPPIQARNLGFAFPKSALYSGTLQRIISRFQSSTSSISCLHH